MYIRPGSTLIYIRSLSGTYAAAAVAAAVHRDSHFVSYFRIPSFIASSSYLVPPLYHQIETVGFKATGRTCTAPGCSAPLHDNTLDWDSKLPDDELQEAIDHADTAVRKGVVHPRSWIPNLGGEESASRPRYMR